VSQCAFTIEVRKVANTPATAHKTHHFIDSRLFIGQAPIDVYAPSFISEKFTEDLGRKPISHAVQIRQVVLLRAAPHGASVFLPEFL
jgi:hypothetical protein